MTFHLVCMGDVTSPHTSPHVGKSWQETLKICCKGFLVPQRSPTLAAMSLVLPILITFNDGCIVASNTSCTMPQMVQKWFKPLKVAKFIWIFASFCAPRTAYVHPHVGDVQLHRNPTLQMSIIAQRGITINLAFGWGTIHANSPTYDCSDGY